jgi:hypothetical protein
VATPRLVPIGGFTPDGERADTRCMIWPAAALAVFLLGFVVVYGSRLQARVEEAILTSVHDDPFGTSET